MARPMTPQRLESISHAAMLVRASLVGHGDLIGVLPGGTALYAYNDGATKTVICRPAGVRPEGVAPHGVHGVRQPELVGMAPARRHRS